MDQAGVHFQTAELGKVVQGGGGTIAYILEIMIWMLLMLVLLF